MVGRPAPAPREVVAEFEKILVDELDLTREAANCSQLRRNFRNSPLLRVPEVHWDWCTPQVMVMERMAGIPIARSRRAARGRRRPPEARARRRRGLLHAGVPRRLLPRRHAPGQHLRRRRPAALRQVRRARLRHRRHALGEGPELPRPEFPRLLPARLPARGHGPPRVGLGAAATRASTSSRTRSASSASRSSTGRSRRSRSARC